MVLFKRMSRPAGDRHREAADAHFSIYTVGKIRALRVDYNYAGRRKKIIQLHFSNSKRLTATVKRVCTRTAAR